MEKMVCGFLFDSYKDVVLLIKKNRPEWMHGLYNGVGGHIEENESPLDAMKREFSEETTYSDDKIDWKKFATLTNNTTFSVDFFFACNDVVFCIDSKTDEEVSVIAVKNGVFFDIYEEPMDNILPNLRWLIPMALSFEHGEKANSFNILEL